MRLADKLHELKDARGLSQRDVAAAVGVSHTTANRWFNGKGEPSIHEAARLARLFAVPIDYLADDEADAPTPPELTDDDRYILRLARDVGVREAARRLAAAPQDVGEGTRIDPIAPSEIRPGPPQPRSQPLTGRNSS